MKPIATFFFVVGSVFFSLLSFINPGMQIEAFEYLMPIDLELDTVPDQSESSSFKGNVDSILARIAKNMVLVEGGTFMMGCTSEQGGDCFDHENPTHQVTVSSFYMSKYEFTQEELHVVMGYNYNISCAECPVKYVSWLDVQEIIAKLNEMTGKRFRLPTEAEWEYAARGGNISRGFKYSGGNEIDSVAWYLGNRSSKTHPVGGKHPNELGLYDMSGNVQEWVSDWYGSYSAGAKTNPIGSANGKSRIFRGGSWNNSARSVRVTHRSHAGLYYNHYDLGFRLAMDVE